jgi:hypothetical protein
MVRYRKPLRWLVITIGALGMFGVVAAGPASASPATAPLSIQLGCIPQGDSVVECFVNITGGVPPYTIHWNISSDTSDDVAARCSAGHPGTAVVTVTDSAGTQISQSKGYNCIGGPPR